MEWMKSTLITSKSLSVFTIFAVVLKKKTTPIVHKHDDRRERDKPDYRTSGGGDRRSRGGLEC